MIPGSILCHNFKFISYFNSHVHNNMYPSFSSKISTIEFNEAPPPYQVPYHPCFSLCQYLVPTVATHSLIYKLISYGIYPPIPIPNQCTNTIPYIYILQSQQGKYLMLPKEPLVFRSRLMRNMKISLQLCCI